MAESRITEKGREKLCKAHAGKSPLPAIKQMALGNGGVDVEGTVLETTGKETMLKHQLLLRDIEGITFPEVLEGGAATGFSTTAQYTMTLRKEDLAGESISEQGLVDEEGDLIAYKTFLPKGKDVDMEFVFDMKEIF